MLDQGAVERVGQRPCRRRSVALDDDVEVTGGVHRAAPRVAHQTAGDERARALARRHARDLGEQRPRRGRQRLLEPRAHRHGARRPGPRDGARARDDHRRRTLGESPSHRQLRRAREHDRQRTRHRARGQVAQSEAGGTGEVVDEHVRGGTAREHAHMTAPGESQRVGGADARRRREHLGIDEIAGGENDLGVGVGAARGHHLGPVGATHRAPAPSGRFHRAAGGVRCAPTTVVI